MESLTLKPRQVADSPEVENWDDDDFDNFDDVQFRAASTATSIVSQHPLPHRDSSTSRLSLRSDTNSNQGDENWDVLVDEQASVKDAIALAKSKGIPLPSNVPRSALEGGTIRRLRGKEIKKVMADDWSEDLDLPTSNLPLKLAKHEDRDLTDSLRQISAAFRTSPKIVETPELAAAVLKSPKARAAAMPVSLDAFRDTDEDVGFGDVPTIKVVKHRQPQKQHPIAALPPPANGEDFNLEDDLEFPTDGELKLSARKLTPRTPQLNDDSDLDWAEGSLGIRDAGTRRAGPSARSSSASALSPTLSSAMTVESEDEPLEGLELPDGPIKFGDKLRQLQEAQAQETQTWADRKPQVSSPAIAQNDFFDDLEIGDGHVFDAAKLTLNRNIKHKTQRSTSPSKRSTTTLNFTTTKPQGTISRLPRFQTAHDRHERARSNLEPVAETGAAVSQFQRPTSRLATHSATSSVTTIPGPVNLAAPSTPSKRGLRSTESRPDIRGEPVTTTNAQLLRAKRSMPAMRALNSPTKPTTYARPSSRQDGQSRLNFGARPRTPTERSESRQEDSRKPGLPFLSSRLSNDQTGLTNRPAAPRHFRRTDSDGSGESMTAAQKSLSRIAAMGRTDTPGRGRISLTAAELAAQAKKTITKPARKRDYGTGNELDIFDDLPTSATIESKFTKAPIAKGPPRSLRSKLGLSHLNPSTTSLTSVRAGADTPTPMTPLSPPRAVFPTTVTTTTNVPRFARDTAASRNAREHRQISTTFQTIRGEPLQPISANWRAQPVMKPTGPPQSIKKTPGKKGQRKPHLIKPLGNDINRPKTEKGMHYNPILFRWEGNENALAPFDIPDFHPLVSSPIPPHASPGTVKASMATIQNVGGNMAGVQVVGGMVFDPRQMKWLKLAETHGGESSRRGGSVGSFQLEEEEDVFAGLEDLKEEDENKSRSSFQYGGNATRSERSRAVSVTSGGIEQELEVDDAGNSSDEWGGVAEEFDVGPDFVRRQRSEEERWRRKVEKWLRGNEANNGSHKENVVAAGTEDWRWAIRDLVGVGSNM